MDIARIESLIRLLENSSVNELELMENGTRMRIAKSATRTQPSPAESQVIRTFPTSEKTAQGAPAESRVESRDHIVIAGLSGTFYRAPMPGETPFVEVGDMIEDGRKLGIVEAMKMMNPVEADCAGRITAIHLADGAPVTAGMPLFSIDRAG